MSATTLVITPRISEQTYQMSSDSVGSGQNVGKFTSNNEHVHWSVQFPMVSKEQLCSCIG